MMQGLLQKHAASEHNLRNDVGQIVDLPHTHYQEALSAVFLACTIQNLLHTCRSIVECFFRCLQAVERGIQFRIKR